MARTKGSKIVNGKVVNPVTQKGNPAFNLNDVEPSQTLDIASAAILPEDLELERSLEAMSQRPEMAIDPEPIGMTTQPEKNQRGEMLSDAIDGYKPASTDDELRTQINLAKVEGCDSIEATLPIAKRYCKDPNLEKTGYFIYYNVKVYIAGEFQKAKTRDSMTIEQKVHHGGR